MSAARRLGPVTLALLLTGCAGRTAPVSAVVEVPEARLQRQLVEAGRAMREGRPAEALAGYMQVAHASGRSVLSREAFLQAGLLRLGGDASLRDPAEAARLLRNARALYPTAEEPLVLSATLALIARMEEAERAAAAATDAALKDGAVQDGELRALRRTVTALRQQLEKRDEALRKAAEAALGRPR